MSDRDAHAITTWIERLQDDAHHEPPPQEQEDERERRWQAFEVACRDFAEAEGWPATIRALSVAMQTQRELIL